MTMTENSMSPDTLKNNSDSSIENDRVGLYQIEQKLDESLFVVLEDARGSMQKELKQCGQVIQQIEETKKQIVRNDHLNSCIMEVLSVKELPTEVKNLLREYLVELAVAKRSAETELKRMESIFNEQYESFLFFRKKIERTLRQVIQDKFSIEQDSIQEIVYDYENKKVIAVVKEKTNGNRGEN